MCNGTLFRWRFNGTAFLAHPQKSRFEHRNGFLMPYTEGVSFYFFQKTPFNKHTITAFSTFGF